MRAHVCGYLAVGIVLISCQTGVAQEKAGDLKMVMRDHAAAIAKADLTRQRAVDKARIETVKQLTKLAGKAHAAKNQEAEAAVFLEILKLDPSHMAARQHFTEQGTLDEVLAGLAKPDDSVPAAPAVASSAPTQTSVAKPAASAGVFQPAENPVAKLAVEKQIEAVRSKLKELNPGFDGAMKPQIVQGRVVNLNLDIAHVKNLEPLKAFIWLESLHLDNAHGARSPLSDLSPLSSLPIGLLEVERASVTDLRPLAEMPLGAVSVNGCPIEDLSPLKGKRLQILDISETQVTDISVVKGTVLHSFNCASTTIADLSPLKGLPLQSVTCDLSEVADLSPLAGARLTQISLMSCPVSDITPLRGMPLLHVSLSKSKVTDLSALKGAPMHTFFCDNTKVKDLSPVARAPLFMMSYDFNNPADLAVVRGISTLKAINGRKVEEFFKLQDAKVQ